jgi:GTP-binding protein HflX
MPAVLRSDREPRPAFPSNTQAILIAVQPPSLDDAAVARSLAELRQLLAGLGIEVVQEVVQKRSVPSASFLGEGKLREVAALTGGPGEVLRGPKAAPNKSSELLVVVDAELGRGELRQLESALGAEVLDRTAVILRVFEARARTHEARLEVELARLTYELSRIRDDHSLGDREGGGGRAARGHTNVELAKRRARDRIAALRKELEQLALTSDQRRATRSEVFRAALVGYTNAGKSALMRGLTGSDVLVRDQLFATLGTTVRKLVPAAVPPIVLADTVGFIDRLPHDLLASFRSTLAEAREAWLLLHVADASDPHFRRHVAVTTDVLTEIGAGSVPSLLVLNKADRLDPGARAALSEEFPNAVVMSALDAGERAALRARIDAFFARHLVERTLVMPYTLLGEVARLREQLDVVREDFAESVTVVARGAPETMARLEALVAAARD